MKQEPLLGRTVAGKYAIESLVGEGAMGAVYRVRQLTLGTTLALKVLHPHHKGDPMFAARFLREAQAASRVDHPSSMRVVDFGEEPDGLLYIAMEYVDGKTLAQVLEAEGPLPVARIVDIASQALAALAVAHDLGVIHRDLKPENIMILAGKDDEGRAFDRVKVCDFGVAKLLVGGARAPSVTAEGLVVGTPEYMSPEQARGEALDARSDVYAMGVLLFHMMTGKVPFDSSTAFGTAFMHVNDEPTCPRLLNPRVDARLEKICLKAMRKRPEQRFATARELRGELRALLGRDDARAEQEGAPGAAPHGLLQQLEGRPRRTGLVAAGVVLLGCAVASGLWARSGPRLRPAASEPVQTATISSAVLPAPPSPVAAPPEPPVLAAAAPAPAGPSSDGAEAASARAGGDAASRAGGRGAPQVRGRGAANASVRRGGGKARASAAPSLAAEDLLLAPDLAPPPGAAAHAGPPGAPKAASPEIAPPAHVDPADAPLPVFPIPPPEPSP